MPFYILNNEAIAPGLRRIAHEQIGIVLDLPASDAAQVQKKVHAVRACCKKMRGLLRLARPVMGDMYKAEDRKFRMAGRELAESRDTEVVANTIALLGGPVEQNQAQDLAVPAAAIERSVDILKERDHAVAGWPLETDGFDDIAPGFAHIYQKCLDKWNAVRNDPGDEVFHSLRRFTKYHWYHVRILEQLNEEKISHRRDFLGDLQMTLGSAHDIVLLESVLNPRDDSDAQLLQRALTRKNELYADALKLCDLVFTQSTEGLVADYSRWWIESRGN